MTAPPASVPEESSGKFEDMIDIWYAPSQVFRRREKGGWGLAMITIAVLMTVLGIASQRAMGPIVQTMIAHSLQGTKDLTPEQREAAVNMGSKFQMVFAYGAILLVPITMFVVGLIVWLVGKFFDAKEELGAAVMIAVFAYFPRLLGALVGLLLATFGDTTQMKGIGDVTLSAAHFLDPNAVSSGIYTLATRLDLFVIWETVLIGIGLSVVGRISREKAIIASILIFIVGSLFPLLGALRG